MIKFAMFRRSQGFLGDWYPWRECKEIPATYEDFMNCKNDVQYKITWSTTVTEDNLVVTGECIIQNFGDISWFEHSTKEEYEYFSKIFSKYLLTN